MKMITKGIVTIREIEEGWNLFWPNEATPEFHSTARQALSAVEAMAKVLANGGVSSIFTVEWFPVSYIGRAAVKFLSQKN